MSATPQFWLAAIAPLLFATASIAADPLPWLDTLAAARKEATTKQRPILIRIGGEACPACRLLEGVVIQPEVQRELGRWTLLYLDAEREAADARKFGVGPIPALRLLAVSGKIVASKDGFQTEEELLAWLKEHFAKAAALPDASLAATGEPTQTEVQRVVRQFGDRDAVVREAAVQRLAPHPAFAREAVVEAFREGKLVNKLTALDLLETWQAPIEGLDPWRPDSLTTKRLAALEAWLKAPLPVEEPTPLTERELTELEDEIKRMLTASFAEATVIRERVARRGAAVRPLVLRLHSEAVDDDARQRLLALRYRLASGAEAPLRRPGLLERLASGDPKDRHQAADELAREATGDNQPLLLELFSDPDPLVREISLRGLKNIGGKQATATLVKLLDDPDPNVRAAVLKQLAEDAPEGMLAKLDDYIRREKDADLLVHAIRFLRELKGEAEPQLMTLLSHESWQVRAEAAEAIYKAHKDSHSHDKADAARLRKALLPLLDDSDAFVVGRAVIGLQNVGDASCVAPLAKAAEKYPTLAAEVVAALTRSEMKQASRSVLQKFRTHALPSVRAAVVNGLVDEFDEDSQEILTAALSDPDTTVRIAGATATLEALARLRMPRDSSSSFGVDPFLNNSGQAAEAEEEEVKPDKDSKWDTWLAEFAAGKHRPTWTSELTALLQKMLKAEAPRESDAAAAVLLPLGDTAAAIAALEKAAKRDPAGFSAAVQSLNWLRFPQRLAMIRLLRDSARDTSELSELLANFDQPPDSRLADEVWTVISRAKDGTLAYGAEQAISASYFGESYIYNFERIEAGARRRGTEALKAHAAKGSAWERLVAIKILLEHAPDEVTAVIAGLADDAEAPEMLRKHAFHLRLASLAPDARRKEAIAALGGDDAGRRKLALAFLAKGKSALERISDIQMALEFPRSQGEEEKTDLTPSPLEQFKPIIPRPPAGLDLPQLTKLAADSDPESAAYAGYLLAVSGQAAGLEPLLARWQKVDADHELDRLVYRAVAVIDNSEHIAVLQRIHARTHDYYLREFYWTIRIMGGPETLDMRKQIRKKLGMSSLQ